MTCAYLSVSLPLQRSCLNLQKKAFIYFRESSSGEVLVRLLHTAFPARLAAHLPRGDVMSLTQEAFPAETFGNPNLIPSSLETLQPFLWPLLCLCVEWGGGMRKSSGSHPSGTGVASSWLLHGLCLPLMDGRSPPRACVPVCHRVSRVRACPSAAFSLRHSNGNQYLGHLCRWGGPLMVKDRHFPDIKCA